MKISPDLFRKKTIACILAILVICLSVPFSFAEEVMDQPSGEENAEVIAESSSTSTDSADASTASGSADTSSNTASSDSSSSNTASTDSSSSDSSSSNSTSDSSNGNSTADNSSSTSSDVGSSAGSSATVNAALGLSGTVTLEGKPLDRDEFTFEIKTQSGSILKTVKNDASGKISFLGTSDMSTLTTAVSSGSAKLTISQKTPEKSDISNYTIDSAVYTLSVSMSADSSGKGVPTLEVTDSAGRQVALNKIDFNNKYNGKSAFAKLKGTKKLEGKTLTADEFSFVLKDSDGNTVETVKNDAEGNIVFNTIAFDEKATKKYTVSEGNVTETGVTKDNTVYDVTVTVEEGSDGKMAAKVRIESSGQEKESISFVNKYSQTNTSNNNNTANTNNTVKNSGTTTSPNNTTSANNANKASNDSKTPAAGKAQTGDTSNVVFYIILLAAFAAVLGGVFIRSARKKGSRD